MVTSFKSKVLLEQALAARTLKNELISSNIANIDTPFYKARDVDFESVLIEKANEMYGKGGVGELKMATSNYAHMQGIDYDNKGNGTIYLRDGHLARNDGNTVDLDVETTELSKNTLMIEALTQTLKRKGGIFSSVIEASGKM